MVPLAQSSQPDKIYAHYVNYAYYSFYAVYATWPPSALIFLQHGDVCTFMQFAAIVVLGDTWKEQQDFAEPHFVHSQLKGSQRCSRRSYKNPVFAIGLSQVFWTQTASIAHAVPQEIVCALFEGMRTASDGPQIQPSWSAQNCPGDFGSETMSIKHVMSIMQFIAIMQVFINTSKNNDTWKGLSIPCTLIWLLSSGSAGMPRLA